MAVNYNVYTVDTERLGVEFTAPALTVRQTEGFLQTGNIHEQSIDYAATYLDDASIFNYQTLGNINTGFEELYGASLKNIRLCALLETENAIQPAYMASWKLNTDSYLSSQWSNYRYITKFDAVTNCLLVRVHIINRTTRDVTVVYYDDFDNNYTSLHATGYDDTNVVIGFSFELYSSANRGEVRLINSMNFFPMIEFRGSNDGNEDLFYGIPMCSFATSDLNNVTLRNLIRPLVYNNAGALSNPRFMEWWWGGLYSSVNNDWTTPLVKNYAYSQSTSLANNFETFNFYPPEDWTTTGFYANDRQYVLNVNGNCYLYPVYNLARIQKNVSALGLYWTGNVESATNSAIGFGTTDNLIHLGVMDENGYTDGSFVSGIECATQWQNTVDDIIGKRVLEPVDPTDPPQPPTPPSDDGEDDMRRRNDTTNLPSIGGIRLVSGTGFSSFYLLSAYHVGELGKLLSQMPTSFWEALGTATDYKMSNILDYISALKWYPINIAASAPALYPDVQVSDIQFGFNGAAKVILTAAGTSYRLGTVNRVFDMGSIDIPYRAAQQTFLDLEPYTDVYANLPYIGMVQLQTNQVLGYTITCYYIIDLITGIATCFLDNGYDTIYTGSGKIGVDISVSGNDIITQSERMSTAYVGTVTHAISNALSIGGSVATDNPAGAAVGTSNMISGLVADSIATANAKRGVPAVVGGGSGFGSTYACQTPAIIVHRPAVKIPAGYGHSIGYIYNTRTRISNLTGLTVCDNPDLSGIPATSAELDMIKNILCSGFYA